MKLKFENLGALEYGEVNIAELTVLCGENNTGKTYVTYLVYCLLHSWKQLVDIDLRDDFYELKKSGTLKVDLNVKVAERWNDICVEALERFKEQFPEMLASNADLYGDLQLHLDVPLGTAWKEKAFKSELRSGGGNLLLSMTKPENSTILDLAAPSSEAVQPIGSLVSFVEDRIFGLMLEETIPDVFIASTERTGATTFKKQLNLAVGNILDLLTQAHKEGEKSIKPQTIFDTLIVGKPDYALPVRHNVQFLNALPDTNADNGELHKQYPDLLKRFESIVGGTYLTKNGQTSFKPKGAKVDLGLGESSSSVRSLLIVWYWLKYFAKKGDMLILDEPELNLHPANQRRLARFIVALVNHGVKVFLTTHSDYIVKEFNTLIMLNGVSDMKFLANKFPEYDASDRLAPEKIVLYMAKEESILRAGNVKKSKAKTIVAAEISESLGVEALSFDTTIDEMNAIQEAIYYGGK